MEYEPVITNFYPEIRGSKIGNCDIAIKRSELKTKEYRNFPVFKKEDRKWISFPCFKRLDKWIPYFEVDEIKENFHKLLKQLEEEYNI